jgi:predicted metal-dependent enzyme (double-stranded beta helix superfamily)
MSAKTAPGPLRRFLSGLEELRGDDAPPMDKIGRLLVALAADQDYLGPLTEMLPGHEPGGHWLSRPERGPRLVLFHRPEGMMACTHSHHCWVAVAPVRGAETHQRWTAVRHRDGRADLRLVDERVLHPGEVATLVPPRDVHNHGHVIGTGATPYSLILLGDDMLRFTREEYDRADGTWRALAPGDPGRPTQ